MRINNISFSRNSLLNNIFQANQNNNYSSQNLQSEDKIDTRSISETSVNSTEEIAKIIGFFTRNLRSIGVGFILYKKEDGKLIEISELEALEKIQKNEEVYFQMTKFSNFNLSISNLFAYDALVSPIDIALTKNVREIMDKSSISNSISIKNPGKEIKVGSPFVIKNVQKLKIIYQVFNPNSNIQVSNDMEKIAQLLSKFIPKTFGTSYNWKFYDTNDKPSIKEKVLNSIVKGLKLGSIAGLTSSFIIAPIGAVIGLSILQIIGLTLGISSLVAISNLSKELIQSLKDPKGKEIDVFTVIKNIMNGKPVYFQEQKSATITIPLIGEYTYYANNRKEVKIKDIKDLELYSQIQG